jgi:hypothetical protein
MRRRSKTPYVPFGGPHVAEPHSTGENQRPRDDKPFVPQEVPDEWKKHAQESWWILFPDLEWTPPDRDL